MRLPRLEMARAARPRPRPALGWGLAWAAILLAGCGSGPDASAQVRATLASFGRAVAARDYRTVCTRLLAPALTDQLAQIGLPCQAGLARGFGRARAPHLTVRSVTVNPSGDAASAVVHTTAANQPPSDDTLGLVRLGGTWRIASLGAAPRR